MSFASKSQKTIFGQIVLTRRLGLGRSPPVMDIRIGIDRPSTRTNILINNRHDVGRQREAMIYAPNHVKEGVTFGATSKTRLEAEGEEDESLGVKETLRWCDYKPPHRSEIAGVDLMAMNKAATMHRATTSIEVREFRESHEPIRLRAGVRRAVAPPRLYAMQTFGRPSLKRLDEEIRYAHGDTPSTSIASLIQGEFESDWIKEKLREMAATANARSSSSSSAKKFVATSVVSQQKEEHVTQKTPFKMKKFAKVQSKVAAMGYF